jgi:hypothetical protein
MVVAKFSRYLSCEYASGAVYQTDHGAQPPPRRNAASQATARFTGFGARLDLVHDRRFLDSKTVLFSYSVHLGRFRLNQSLQSIAFC